MAEQRYEFKRKPRRCPACGHVPVGTILYGLPALPPELEKGMADGTVVLGGCVLELDQPTWECSHCQTSMYKTVPIEG